ncbi:hypothetical protein BJ742DRAFT_377668 [Cladochytrium replicatum]|nr:hypothetical protein BJ742DRAFT_377668 [Cladochytrium replicatum]
MEYLQVPPFEKNFLLSPPGSPPIGWVQTKEAGPVPGGHSEALWDALTKQLENDRLLLDGPDDDEDALRLQEEQRRLEARASETEVEENGKRRKIIKFVAPRIELHLPVVVVEHFELAENGLFGAPVVQISPVSTPAPEPAPARSLPKTPVPQRRATLPPKFTAMLSPAPSPIKRASTLLAPPPTSHVNPHTRLVPKTAMPPMPPQ